MLYNILNLGSAEAFNMESLLLRSFLAIILAFIISIFGLKYFISYLKSKNVFQPIRAEGPEGHLITKQKTPTMGGFVSLIAILSSTLLFANMTDIYVIATLIIATTFAIIGLIDDIIKVFYKNTKGFKGSIKLFIEVLICGLTILWLVYNNSPIIDTTAVFIPFVKTFLYIGFLFIPFIIIVIVGSTNGVNLTDGLDGLAIIPIMLCSIMFGIIAISSGFGLESRYISTLNLDNPSELCVICASIIGAGLAFFIYNKKPAKIFMGDVGSLMYGAFLGTFAVILRYEIFYGIMGLLFAIESLSVIIQVTSYKLFQKRVFKMTPIHHHFEKMGWTERKVVLTFWGFTFFCLIVSLIGIINF